MDRPSFDFSAFLVLEDGKAPSYYHKEWINQDRYTQAIGSIAFKPLEVSPEDAFTINRYTTLTLEVGHLRSFDRAPLFMIVQQPLSVPIVVQAGEEVKLFVACERSVSKPIMCAVCLYSTRIVSRY